MTDRTAPDHSAAAEWRANRSDRSTRERVYEVVLQLSEPTRVSTVADRADVSTETAREYLAWFAEIGLVVRESDSPATYSRNESYFEWRRVQRLAARPLAELREELAGLQETVREYRERYATDDPDQVDALEHAPHDDVESVWEDLQTWRTARQRIEDLERARRRHEESDVVA